MNILTLAAAVTSATSATKKYFAHNASQHLETYWLLYSALFLTEGVDGAYPMPASSDVPDLLKALRGVPGVAVHTTPGTTVTEGQGYAMLVAGMRKDTETLKKLAVAWQANGQGLAGAPACGGCGTNDGAPGNPRDICTKKQATPCLCCQVAGAYMPAWEMPLKSMGSMGSAVDGDEDAVTGLIYLAELMDSDEVRAYAVRSIAAFVLADLGAANASANSRPVPAAGDGMPASLQTIYLWRGGSCWGGFDQSSPKPERNNCLNPAYFSPGQWRLFRDYLAAHPQHVPAPHTAESLGVVLNSSIVWGYNTLSRISCANGLVSNWWTLPKDKGWPWNGKLDCANSGTSAGAYYPDASRSRGPAGREPAAAT